MLSGNHAKQKRLSKGFIPCHHAKNGSKNLLNLMIKCTFKVEKSGNFSAINQNVGTAEKVEKEIKTVECNCIQVQARTYCCSSW